MKRRRLAPDPTVEDRCLVRYDRRGDVLRLTLTGLTNHELREVLVGLWARLDDDDRRDHVAELLHYVDALANPEAYPDRFLSPVAQAIKDGPDGEAAIDLIEVERRVRAERSG